MKLNRKTICLNEILIMDDLLFHEYTKRVLWFSHFYLFLRIKLGLTVEIKSPLVNQLKGTLSNLPKWFHIIALNWDWIDNNYFS